MRVDVQKNYRWAGSEFTCKVTARVYADQLGQFPQSFLNKNHSFFGVKLTSGDVGSLFVKEGGDQTYFSISRYFSNEDPVLIEREVNQYVGEQIAVLRTVAALNEKRLESAPQPKTETFLL